ncbi:MAG: hypothetical protein LQ337_006493 [Flavoplaca oasis]|nr:MAG: hypothetical protein LQ337_006493 [Flavoplaca oasis]
MGKSLQARFDEIELLSAISQYTNFLKPLYTDISFEDLAVTASDLYGTNLTPEQIANSFASDCEHEKKLVREERVKTNVDLANLETEGPFLCAVSTIHTQHRSADVERLSKSGPIIVEDLVDLRPSDLKELFYAREKHREAVQSQESSRSRDSY